MRFKGWKGVDEAGVKSPFLARKLPTRFWSCRCGSKYHVTLPATKEKGTRGELTRIARQRYQSTTGRERQNAWEARKKVGGKNSRLYISHLISKSRMANDKLSRAGCRSWYTCLRREQRTFFPCSLNIFCMSWFVESSVSRDRRASKERSSSGVTYVPTHIEWTVAIDRS